jgi:glycosyltransferase involved in cell wall biosynthesis
VAVAISVLIPAYNRAAVIGAAIESVLAQRLPDGNEAGAIEIVVVDDASSDDLAAALCPFGDRLRLVRHEQNAGAAAARNTAVAAARGDHLAFLDSDDVWLPGKLARQLAAMRQFDWKASCTAYLLARQGAGDCRSPNLATGPVELDRMVWGCFVGPGSTMICRKSLFDEIGTFDARLQRQEDWDWLLRLVHRHALGFLAEPLARVAPAARPDPFKVLPAADRLWDKHAAGLTRRQRRHFAAALNVERASAFYRNGDRLAATALLLRSLLRVPIGNGAISAVLHNRLAPDYRAAALID